MKIQLELDSDKRFVVNLKADLSAYCNACKIQQEKHARLNQLKSENSTQILEAEKELEDAKASSKIIRNEYSLNLSNVFGDMHWVNIKELFRTQCKLEDEAEKQLHSFLSLQEPVLLTEENDVATPVVSLLIECLDIRFIELLKNSIDAMVCNYIEGRSTETSLNMSLALTLVDDQLSLTIIDNCGGFPESYLQNFADIINSELDVERSTKRSNEYSFGGNGLGLSILAQFILEGKLAGRGKAEHRYQVTEGSTVFQLSNSNGGAQITIKTPLKPFPPVVEEVVLREEVQLRLLPSRKRAGSFFEKSADELKVSRQDDDDSLPTPGFGKPRTE